MVLIFAQFFLQLIIGLIKCKSYKRKKNEIGKVHKELLLINLRGEKIEITILLIKKNRVVIKFIS